MHWPCRFRFGTFLALFSVTVVMVPLHAAGEPATAKTYGFHIVHAWPHDADAFTQGLVYVRGNFFEGTGLYGHSTLREVQPETGKVLRTLPLDPKYFGEGVTLLGSRIYQITWQNHKGFVYDRDTFRLEREFTYDCDGWGLTTDSQQLILSDGTDTIRFLDPDTFAITRTIKVHNQTSTVKDLNELEFVKGEIYANVWQTNWIACIDPNNGEVKGAINLSHLLAPGDQGPETDVLNGIAYDADHDRLFVTGKKWPKLFEIELVEQK